MRFPLPFLALVACGGGAAPPPTSPSTPPTEVGATADTGTTGVTFGETDPTITLATDGGCTVTLTPSDPGLGALVAGTIPGEVLAGGLRGVHRRTADGDWTVLPGTAEHLSPYRMTQPPDGSVWAQRVGRIERLDPATNTWVDTAFPGDTYFLAALGHDATGVVSAITLDHDFVSDVGVTGSAATVWSHDGSAWVEAAHYVGGYLADPALLPDGRMVAFERYDDTVVVSDGAALVPVPLPPGVVPDALAVAPDGTVLVGGDLPAAGPIDALVAWGSLPDGAYLGDLSAMAADDLWMLFTTYDSDGAVSTVLHHDGTTTSEVGLPSALAGRPLYEVQGDGLGGAVLTGADPSTRYVVAGAASGLDLERDELTIGRLEHLAVDDVDGSFHAFGTHRVARWDGTDWALDDRGLDVEDASRGAVSDGRTLLASWSALAVDDATGLTVTEFPDHSFYAFAGADGTLFAAGVSQPYEQSADGPAAFVERGDGQGWQPLDLTGLPVGAEVHGAWADGPDDLWLGLSIGGGGALAHHDGTTLTIVSSDLELGPSWMARLSDGALWLAASVPGSGSGLARYDGTTLAAVALPDDRQVLSVWRDDDGGLFADTGRHVPDPDEPGDTTYQRSIEYLAPSGTDWVTVHDDTSYIPTALTGYGGEVVVGVEGGFLTLHRACP